MFWLLGLALGVVVFCVLFYLFLITPIHVAYSYPPLHARFDYLGFTLLYSQKENYRLRFWSLPLSSGETLDEVWQRIFLVRWLRALKRGLKKTIAGLKRLFGIKTTSPVRKKRRKKKKEPRVSFRQVIEVAAPQKTSYNPKVVYRRWKPRFKNLAKVLSALKKSVEIQQLELHYSFSDPFIQGIAEIAQTFAGNYLLRRYPKVVLKGNFIGYNLHFCRAKLYPMRFLFKLIRL